MLKYDMTPDILHLGPSVEIPQPTRFEQAIARLSGPIESRTPLTAQDLDPQSISAIRETLIGIGAANLENPTQETRDSLFSPDSSQIRNLNHQRGVAIRNIFGGNMNAFAGAASQARLFCAGGCRTPNQKNGHNNCRYCKKAA